MFVARGLLGKILKKSRKVHSILKKNARSSTVGDHDKPKQKRKKKKHEVRFTLPDQQGHEDKVMPSPFLERVSSCIIPKALVCACASPREIHAAQA